MYLISRLALIAVIGGALFFGLRDGGEEAVNGNPEALWDSKVDQVDAMIKGDAQGTVSDPLESSLTYAEGVSTDVVELTD
jgi:hypothetical protein